MRRRKDERVRSSAGQVGFHGVRKSRLASRNAAHSAQSDICGARSTTPAPAIVGIWSDKLTVRKKAMVISRQDQIPGAKISVPVVSPPTSRGPARETVGDRCRSFKSGAGTERG